MFEEEDTKLMNKRRYKTEHHYGDTYHILTNTTTERAVKRTMVLTVMKQNWVS